MNQKQFIRPTIDYAFKKIFGSDRSQDILISFLNGIIYKGENTISSLTIVNPYNPGNIETLKDSYLDIRAILHSGEIVLIEMQVARVSAFHKRVTHNLCKAYANQLESGVFYSQISPVIAVTIVDFTLFKESEKVIHHFVLKDKEDSWEYPEHELQLIYVELPRFIKQLPELTTLAEKWIYFMKKAQELEEIPESLAEVSEIEQALNIANLANMTPTESEAFDRRNIQLQDEIGRREYAIFEARKQALEEGREEGQMTQARTLVTRLLNRKFPDRIEEISSLVARLSLSALEELTETIFELETWEDVLNGFQNLEE